MQSFRISLVSDLLRNTNDSFQRTRGNSCRSDSGHMRCSMDGYKNAQTGQSVPVPVTLRQVQRIRFHRRFRNGRCGTVLLPRLQHPVLHIGDQMRQLERYHHSLRDNSLHSCRPQFRVGIASPYHSVVDESPKFGSIRELVLCNGLLTLRRLKQLLPQGIKIQRSFSVTSQRSTGRWKTESGVNNLSRVRCK